MESWWRELDDAVLACLADGGAMAPAEIGRRLGLSEDATASLLAMLVQQGRARIALAAPASRAAAAA